MSATPAGEFRRKVVFQQRPVDPSTGEAGAWTDGPSRSAKIVSLTGGEAVKEQRLAGQQPVLITVRRDSLTREIDNAWRAYDERRAAPPDPAATVWNITSVIWNEAEDVMEILAVEHKDGASG